MVTGEKQEGQHDDSPREVESIVDKLAETDMLLSQMEFAVAGADGPRSA